MPSALARSVLYPNAEPKGAPIMMPLRKILATAASVVGVVLSCLLATSAARSQGANLAIDDDLRKSDHGWVVGFSNWAAGCVASATYDGGTTIWLGVSARFGEFVAFTNQDWQSIEPRKAYSIQIKTGGYGNWRGNFTGFDRGKEKGVISTGLKREFLVDFARSSTFGILLEGRQVANISLSGSRTALNEAINCHGTNKVRADAIAASAKKSTDENKKVSSGGTGFMVSTTGHVLTNQHVVDGCTVFQVNRVGALPETARLLAADIKNDLALLKTELKQADIPAFRTRVRVGESVSVYGFPLTQILATTGNFTVGNLTATAGMHDDSREYQISAPVQAGNSGGPLIDQFGNVIGVIVSKLRSDVAQNANFAIKASIAINFLESNGVTPKESSASRGLDPADVAALARAFTVRIQCQN